MFDWKQEIVRNCYWRQIAYDANPELTWRVPRVAAKPEAIVAAERAFGFGFPPEYRQFLLHADGWPWFMIESELFGTRDFISGRAMSVLEPKLTDALAKIGFQAGEYVPIGAGDSGHDREVFLLIRPDGPTLPGGVVSFDPDPEDDPFQRFISFEDFFLSIINTNEIIARSALDQIQGRQ